MAEEREVVQIVLLGKVFNMTCEPGDVEELKQTGRKLNEKLIELGGAEILPENKIEPVVAAVAINLVNELMDKEGRLVQMEYQLEEMVKRIDSFDSKIQESTGQKDW